MTTPGRARRGLPAAALVLVGVTSSACGSAEIVGRPVGGGGTAGASVTLGEQPRDYRARVHSSCGERGLLGTYDVVVRDGATTQVRPIGRARLGRPHGLPLDAVPTMDEMAALAREADAQQLLDLVLDQEGRVRRVEIDHRPTGIDDEECYVVSRLRVDGGPGGRDQTG